MGTPSTNLSPDEDDILLLIRISAINAEKSITDRLMWSASGWGGVSRLIS